MEGGNWTGEGSEGGAKSGGAYVVDVDGVTSASCEETTVGMEMRGC